MAEKEVFRKVSLERLSSPEELDQQLTVTSPIGWVAFLAVTLLIAAGLVWGFLGSIANKTNGEGIIISSGGVINVAHHSNGQVIGVSVKEGDFVEKGDVLMRIDQAEIVEEINQLKEDLEIVQNFESNAPYPDSSKLNYRLYDVIIGMVTAKLEVERAGIELQYSRDRHDKLKILKDNGAIPLSELQEAEEEVRLYAHDLAEKQEELRQQVEKVALKELELKEEIKKKQDELLTNCEIISPIAGRVLEVSVRKGDLITAGKSVCTIVKGSEQTESLEAVLYVAVEEGKLILPGMDVNISPTTVKKEEYGFMLGKVVSVSEYPASTEGMMLTLGSQELVTRLAGEKAPLEVRVSLINDNSTVSGYQWSTPEGPPLNIDSGTLCLGEVKVSKQRPVSLVIPFLKKILPL